MWAAAKVQKPSLKTAVSISWDWINYLCDNTTCDYLFRGHENDSAVAEAVSKSAVRDAAAMVILKLNSTGNEDGW